MKFLRRPQWRCGQCGGEIRIYFNRFRNPKAQAIRFKQNFGRRPDRDHDLCQACYFRLMRLHEREELYVT